MLEDPDAEKGGKITDKKDKLLITTKRSPRFKKFKKSKYQAKQEETENKPLAAHVGI